MMIVVDDAKLWAGFAFVGGGHRVYYSGDTGLFPALREIGERLVPFELTLIEVTAAEAPIVATQVDGH